jgi:SAM-dependent methyltransferase
MKIDNFNDKILSVLADPISHSELIHIGDDLVTESNFYYPLGDFRIAISNFVSKEWGKGQVEFENYNSKYLNSTKEQFESIDRETDEVYKEIPLTGKILDVGGAYGTACKQAGVDVDDYIVLDPMVCKWAEIKSSTFKSHYSCLESVLRIPGYSEALPFKNSIFDTIHMRSCIDHFDNPHRSLLEARRVLKNNGRLVVGISLEGSYKLSSSRFVNFGKGYFKSSAIGKLYERLFDPHMFHPTMNTLEILCKKAGFQIVKMIKQNGYSDVVYFEAIKSPNI